MHQRPKRASVQSLVWSEGVGAGDQILTGGRLQGRSFTLKINSRQVDIAPARYGSRQEYLATLVPESLKGFSLKRGWTTKFAQNEVWLCVCKYAQKAGYHRCDYKIKLDFLSHSTEVVVLDNRAQHRHEVDSDYALSGKKYQWTGKQEQILLPLIHQPPRRCLRELKKEEALGVQGIYPTLTQINSKKKYMLQKKGEVTVAPLSTYSSSVQLAWDQFNANWSVRFKQIRTRGDFADVTLVTDDGTREGHQLILASGSRFFEQVLCMKQVAGGHPHPLLYLRGVDTCQLDYLLDFLYSGQVV